MSEQKRYLLGRGQELFEPQSHPKRHPGKASVYTLEQAKARLLPQIKKARAALAAETEDHCYNGERTVALTVHPSFISKTSAPMRTIQRFGFDLLGSNGVKVETKATEKKPDGVEKVGMRLYLSGTPDAWQRYEQFAFSLDDSENVTSEYERLRTEFTSLESIEALAPNDRLGKIPVALKSDVEIVLHKGSNRENVLTAFVGFLDGIGVEVDPLRIIDTSTLVFVPVDITRTQLSEIARFSHVRFIRSAAKLRTFRPATMSRGARTASLNRPDGSVECEDFRVAIFDGGLGHTEFSDWVDYSDLAGGPLVAELLDHGSNVTSAFLFGHTTTDSPVVPPCRVDHFKVVGGLDADAYRILNRIIGTLQSHDYNFANISLGPDYAIADDHIDPWTVALDEIAARQSIFISVAAGNDGRADRLAGNHRIQPPSDGVNVVGVGAVESFGDPSASRAAYSSFGPGRCPGLVKPDLSVFGGSVAAPFCFVQSFSGRSLAYDAGTSFASPLIVRAAAGIKARIQNEDLTPLAVKALLVHHSERRSQPMEEVGWGVLSGLDPERMIVCEDGEVKVIYQGVAQGKKIVRTPIPLPDIQALINAGELSPTTMAQLKVTMCVSSELNPADSANYTKVGVSVTHRSRISEENVTRALFSKKVFKFSDESVLRHDSHKWATTIVGSDSLRVSSWEEPVLDFHFQERERIGDTVGSARIPYAIVISVRIAALPDLYERVKARYRKLAPVRARATTRIRNREG